MAAHPIYVQIDIAGPVDRVWELTQTPALHERWDLRFTEIRYLPRPDPGQPQRFEYATRIGFGLGVRGLGETVGGGEAGGLRTSALRFWSTDWKSLIADGSGYWKYEPRGGGVRFVTGYGYTVRFGPAGRAFDRLVFRPLMGWATAWSFDRLRLWVEDGADPATTLRRAVAHGLARSAVAFVWLYQGIVPKLVRHDRDELAMLRAGGLSAAAARRACDGFGWAEVAVGLAVALAWRSRWPLWLTAAAMPVALAGVAVTSPAHLARGVQPGVVERGGDGAGGRGAVG